MYKHRNTAKVVQHSCTPYTNLGGNHKEIIFIVSGACVMQTLICFCQAEERNLNMGAKVVLSCNDFTHVSI